jgi:calcineurin-like phosphoesterase family protein
MIWVTGSQHFGHTNIINYWQRPFANAKEMNNIIINRWNESVDHNDKVFILGALTLSGQQTARRLFKALKGRIHVLYNVDSVDFRWQPREFGKTNFVSKSGYRVILEPPVITMRVDANGERRIFCLSHFPFIEWAGKRKGTCHLYSYGNKDLRIENATHAGVDTNYYYPVSLDLRIKEGMI